MSWLGRLFDTNKQSTHAKPFDPAWLKTDMHAHFLYGVDDGARTEDESLAMLTKMHALGYQKCIITPHIKTDTFPNTETGLIEVFKQLKTALNQLGHPIEIELAAEYFLDDAFMNRLEKGNLLCFGKERYILVEFSFINPPIFEKEAFERIKLAGYVPVLAHFERYLYFHGSIEMAEVYRSMGVNIQLNVNSLSGHYGPEVKKQAELLIDHFMVDFVATDAHRMDHLALYESNLNSPYLAKLGDRLFKNQGL